MSKRRKVNRKLCAIGTCSTGDEAAYNACQVKRPSGLKVNRISFGPTFANNQLYYNDTLYKRVWYWRLFQQDRPRFSKLILSDIAIRFVFSSIHTGQIGNLVGIAPWAFPPR